MWDRQSVLRHANMTEEKGLGSFEGVLCWTVLPGDAAYSPGF